MTGPVLDLMDDAELGELAGEQLKFTLLMFDAFHDVEEKAKAGNANAKAVLQSWADAEWFTRKDDVPAEIKLTVFKVYSRRSPSYCLIFSFWS